MGLVFFVVFVWLTLVKLYLTVRGKDKPQLDKTWCLLLYVAWEVTVA